MTIYSTRTIPTTSYSDRTIPSTSYSIRDEVGVYYELGINGIDRLGINGTDTLLVKIVSGTPYTTRITP